jgi:hypothetical protein
VPREIPENHNGRAEITARGTCWATNQSDLLNNINAHCTPESGTALGTFSDVRELPEGATIYFRGYAANAAGLIGYSPAVMFISGSTAPTLSNATVTNVLSTSAVIGASIDDDGGAPLVARGTGWCVGTTCDCHSNTVAEGGTTVGTFSQLRTGLPTDSDIRACAYAKNSSGLVGWSAPAPFKTDLLNPEAGGDISNGLRPR